MAVDITAIGRWDIKVQYSRRKARGIDHILREKVIKPGKGEKGSEEV